MRIGLIIFGLMIFGIIFFVGCDGFPRGRFIIVDKESKLPLDGVGVSTEENDPTPYCSNKNGEYVYNAQSMSSYFTLYFHKDGYKKFMKEFHSDHPVDTVYLEKLKN